MGKKGPFNAVLVAQEAGKAIFYIFNKKGDCTDAISLDTDQIVGLCNAMGKSLAKANRRLYSWRKATFVTAIVAGLAVAGNYDLRKELKECREELYLKDQNPNSDESSDLFDETESPTDM